MLSRSPLKALLSGAILAAIGHAQDAPASASSPAYLLASFEFGPGGSVASTNHLLVGCSASGAAALQATSSQHVLTGGFPASLDAATTGGPWLSCVEPGFSTMAGAPTLTIRGTGLAGGTSTTVTIGGKPATVLGRTADQVVVKLPDQDAPGFVPVTVQTALGQATLAQGLGVLPLLQEEPAAASGVPFSLVFKGTQGDTVLWAIGIASIAPIRIDTLRHGLAIHPSVLLVLPGFAITAPSGEFRLVFPPQIYPTGSVLAQAVFVSNHPGYSPGAFSNVIEL